MRFIAQYTNDPLSEVPVKYSFNHNTGKLVTSIIVYAIKGEELITISPEFIYTENIWGGVNGLVSYYNTVEVFLKKFTEQEGEYQLNIDLEFQN